MGSVRTRLYLIPELCGQPGRYQGECVEPSNDEIRRRNLRFLRYFLDFTIPIRTTNAVARRFLVRDLFNEEGTISTGFLAVNDILEICSEDVVAQN